VTGVSQPIENGVGHDGIGEESWPVGHGSVGSEDDAFGTEASVDDGIEALSGLLIDGLEAEVIDDKQIDFEQAADEDVQTVLEVCRSKLGKELMEAVESNGEHHTASLMSERFCQMSLASAGGAEEEDSLTVFDEATGGKSLDAFCVDGRIEGEVKGVQCHLFAQVCTVQETLDAARSPQIELIGKKHGEEVFVGEVVGFSFHDACLEMFAEAGELQDAQLLDDLVVHRGCSCSLMK